MYFLNYVDRNAIAQARLNNLEEDLGMSGVQFNTCVSMLVFPKTRLEWKSDGYEWQANSLKSFRGLRIDANTFKHVDN
jgi:hypothetical protein